MTLNNPGNIPVGLYILSGISLFSIFVILYYSTTAPFYLYLTIILIPILIYMGVGIIKKWPAAKQTVMIVAMLLFIGAVVDVGAALFIGGTQALASIRSIIGIIVRLTILPVVYFYFRSEEVKSYFEAVA